MSILSFLMLWVKKWVSYSLAYFDFKANIESFLTYMLINFFCGLKLVSKEANYNVQKL